MMQLYPIFVVALVLAADRGFARSAENAGWLAPTLVAVVPVAVLLGVVAIAVRVCQRRLARGGSGRPIFVLDRITYVARLLMLVSHAVALLLAGWLEAIRSVTGNLVLVDELIAILPPLVGAVGLWWLHYPIERRLREVLLIRRLDRGATVYPTPTRGVYVLQQIRLHLLLLLAPILVIVTLAESISFLFAEPMLASWPAWTVDVATLGAGLCVFFCAPLIARVVLSVERLGPGTVREDLEEICRRHGVRVREFLMWRTGGSMINAAVMGLVGPLRYVLLTDSLIETMSREQVQAVMAHEIGHVRRHHMPWLVSSLLAMLLLSSLVISAPILLLDMTGFEWSPGAVVWVDGIGTVLAAGIALLGFGWISRRYERQADTFAVQHLSGLGRESEESGAITAEAILAMHGALEAVARLNTVDPRRPSWRHGSIAWRQAYLASIVGRRFDALPIDRLVRRLKLVSATVLVVSGIAMGLIEWTLESSVPDPGGTVSSENSEGWPHS